MRSDRSIYDKGYRSFIDCTVLSRSIQKILGTYLDDRPKKKKKKIFIDANTLARLELRALDLPSAMLPRLQKKKCRMSPTSTNGYLP